MNNHPYPVNDPRDPRAKPKLVFFEEVTEPNKRASAEAGTPMFDNVVIANVMMPGDSKSTVKYEMLRTRPDGTEKLSREAQGIYKEAFAAWRERREPTATGTPLSEVAWMDRATAETFRAKNIFTLQQLADISDQAIGAIPRGLHWREKARAMLAEGGKDAELTRLAEENAEMKERLANLERMLSDREAKSQGFSRKKPAAKREAEAA